MAGNPPPQRTVMTPPSLSDRPRGDQHLVTPDGSDRRECLASNAIDGSRAVRRPPWRIGAAARRSCSARSHVVERDDEKTGSRRAVRPRTGSRRGRRGHRVLHAPVLGAANSKRRNCRGIRGVVFEVPETSMGVAARTGVNGHQTEMTDSGVNRQCADSRAVEGDQSRETCFACHEHLGRSRTPTSPYCAEIASVEDANYGPVGRLAPGEN